MSEDEVLVRGSRLRTKPRSLWSDVLEGSGNTGAKLSEGRARRRDHGRARAEVIALRVPFENFTGYYEYFEQSPLHLVTNAADKLKKLEVMASPVMRATIQVR